MTREEWAKKLNLSLDDPNLDWHIEQETANNLPVKPILIVPAGKPLGLHKPKDVKMPVPYNDPD